MSLMDNRALDFTSKMDDLAFADIGRALQLVLSHEPAQFITHYIVREDVVEGAVADYLNPAEQQVQTLTMLKGPRENALQLPPYDISLEDMQTFIYRWLQSVSYGPEPDIDGECEPGYRLFTDQWGEAGGFSNGIISVQPVWAMLGK